MQTVKEFRDRANLLPNAIKRMIIDSSSRYHGMDGKIVRFTSVVPKVKLKNVVVGVQLDDYQAAFCDWFPIMMPISGRGYVSIIGADLIGSLRLRAMHGMGIVEWENTRLSANLRERATLQWIGPYHDSVYDAIWYQDEADAIDASMWYQTLPNAIARGRIV